MFTPLNSMVRESNSKISLLAEKPTGWAKVDRTVGEIRRRLAEADTEEKFQAVGLLCREALISLAEAVYVPSKHPSLWHSAQ